MVFTAILAILVQKAKTATPMINSVKDCATPIPYKEKAMHTNEMIRGIRLLYLDTSQPENGSPIKELIGMTNNKLPSSASLKSKFDLIDGILEAQVAKPKPNRKK